MTRKNTSNLHLVPVLREKAWKCDHGNGLKIMNKSNTLRYCRKDIHYQVYPQDIPVICYENRNLINVEGHQDNVYAVYVSIPGVDWFPNTLSLSVWPFLPFKNQTILQYSSKTKSQIKLYIKFLFWNFTQTKSLRRDLTILILLIWSPLKPLVLQKEPLIFHRIDAKSIWEKHHVHSNLAQGDTKTSISSKAMK